MNGYIKLYRKTLENPIIMKDKDCLSIWIWLLLQADRGGTQKTFKGETITLEPGQLQTGRKVISTSLKINESKVERVLNLFEKCLIIEQQKSSQNRVITIKKWQEYQVNEQQMNNKRTTNEQQVNTIQEYKNIRNREIKESISKDIQKKYFENLKVNTIFIDFLEQRKKLKAVNSERAINSLINKLNNYDDEIKYEMIEQSIVNSWKGLFDLKNKKTSYTFSDLLKEASYEEE